MTEAEIMNGIRRLSKNYINYLNGFRFSLYILRGNNTSAINFAKRINAAKTLQEVLKLLNRYKKDYSRQTTLKFNSTPWWRLVIEVFVFVLTFPISVPLLMLWSWLERGTFNFIKPDVAIYVEEVLRLCNNQVTTEKDLGRRTAAGLSAREGSSAVSPKQGSSTVDLSKSSNEQGVFMPIFNSNPLQKLIGDGSSPAMAAKSEKHEDADKFKDEKALATVIGEMAKTFSRAMDAHPTMFLDNELLRTKGKPVILDSKWLLQQKEGESRLRITYASLWTKPWQELDAFEAEIKLKTHFNFKRPQSKTNEVAMNIVPKANTSLLGMAANYGLSFYYGDFKSYMQKGRRNGYMPAAYEAYEKALSFANNNAECVLALEALINYQGERIICHEKELRSMQSLIFDERWLIKHHNEAIKDISGFIDEYVDRLPENYHRMSATALALEATFTEVWRLMAENEFTQAWKLFNTPRIDAMIDSGFVQRALPHLVAMWKQLLGVFCLNDMPTSSLIKEEDLADCGFIWLKQALEKLQEYEMPEALALEQDAILPCNNIKAHVEDMFKEVPSELIKKNAHKSFFEQMQFNAERRCPTYRYASRGEPGFIPEVFRIIAESVTKQRNMLANPQASM